MFSKRQASELITAIKGRGEIPLKFVYLGKGAQHWNNIAKQRSGSGGGINSVESELLTRRAVDFLRVFSGKKINVIDIGCGNAEPVFPILSVLAERGIAFRYVPIDISSEMLDLAEKTIKKKYPSCEVQKYQLDFELGNFSDITYDLKHDGSANLLMFLGSTLGNHSDRNRVLTNFRDSMSSDDYLIIGVEMTNLAKVNKLLAHYQGKVIEQFLYYVPETIGIKRRYAPYTPLWNDRDTQVEIWVTMKKDVKVNIGMESFTIEKDERLLLGRSVKFTEWTFSKLISDVGFRTELLTTTHDRGYVLAMVQPTRYGV